MENSSNDENLELNPTEVSLKFLMEIAKDLSFISNMSLIKINDFSTRLTWTSNEEKLEKVAINMSTLLKKNLTNHLDIFAKLEDQMQGKHEVLEHISKCKAEVLESIKSVFGEAFKTKEKSNKESKENESEKEAEKISKQVEGATGAVEEEQPTSTTTNLTRNDNNEKETNKIGLSLRKTNNESESTSEDVTILTCSANPSQKPMEKQLKVGETVIEDTLENDDEEMKFEKLSLYSATTDSNPELVNLPDVNNRRESTDSPDSSQSYVFDFNKITYQKIELRNAADKPAAGNHDTSLSYEFAVSSSSNIGTPSAGSIDPATFENDLGNEEDDQNNDNGNQNNEGNRNDDIRSQNNDKEDKNNEGNNNNNNINCLNNDNNDIDYQNNDCEKSRDELLYLLKEVELPQANSFNNVEKRQTSLPKFSKKREKELLEWTKKWVKEKDSMSESDDVSEFSLSSFNLSGSDEEKEEQEEENDNENKSTVLALQKTQLKDLQIKLIDFLKYNFTYEDNIKRPSRKRTLSEEVDNLCNLESLKKNRTGAEASSFLSKSRKKRYKKHRQRKSSGTESSDSETETTLSNFTESEDEITENDSEGCKNDNNDGNVVVDQNELLAKSLCNNIRDSSSESDGEMSDIDLSNISDCSSGEDGKKGKKASHTENKGKKRKLTEDEKRRKEWKKDPLLHGKLTESDSSSDESIIQTTKKKKPNILQSSSESEKNIISDKENPSRPSSCTNIDNKENKNFIINKSNSKKFNLSNLSSSDTESNSDIELIAQAEAEDLIDISDDENANSGSKKGRRNIRALLSQELLTESTQKANYEEMERVNRLEKIASQRESQSSWDNPDIFILDPNPPRVRVHTKLARRLKPHQREGVLFMWLNCFESLEQIRNSPGTGCILAHCMGLGKTFQVIALIHTLLTNRHIGMKHVVVVCPLSTVQNWKKEFDIAFENFISKPLTVLTIGNRREINRKFQIVQGWRIKGGTLIVSYETFQTLVSQRKLEKYTETTRKNLLEALVDPGPDLVVCDEGHLIRNENSLRAKALNRVKTRRRIVLTGTPLQNNLIEYYQMVQFVKPNLLGNSKEFRTNFINPITNGQYDDSTPSDIKCMKRRTHVLYQLLENTVQRYETAELAQYLPKMLDYAIFINLSALQKILYTRYIEIAMKTNGTLQRKQFFKDYRTIYAICSHPYTLAKIEARNKNPQMKKIVEKDVINLDPDEEDEENVENEWWKSLMFSDVDELYEYSYKFAVMKYIIEEAETLGDKVLLFSQSLSEMDAIEHFLQTRGTITCPNWIPKVNYYRMDGTVLPEERSNMCDNFNDPSNTKLKLFMMSHKVGGLGLNLVAANRVILMGVNFNPSYDTQSIYRAYRFGQNKIVYIYRLISMGTMEEKVYHRCVTKLAVSSRVVDKHQIARHYKSIELQEMYKYDFDKIISRQTFSVPEDVLLGRLLCRKSCIVTYHEHQALLQNRPDECLDEEEKRAAWEEFNRINQPVVQQLDNDKPNELIQNNDLNVLNESNKDNIQLVNNGQNLNKDPLDIDNNDPLELPQSTAWTSSNYYENDPNIKDRLLESIRNDMRNTFNLPNPPPAKKQIIQNGLPIDEDDVIISETISEVSSTQSSIVIPHLNQINNAVINSNSDIITID